MSTVRGYLLTLGAGLVILLWGCMGKEVIREAEVKEGEKAAAIEATAAPGSAHPEIIEGITCADCHEVLVDATTKATETWLYNNYLKFSAGEGLESNDATKKHVLDILGGRKHKNTYMLSTCINNTPLATTFDGAIDPDEMILYIFSEKGTEKLSHMRTNPRVSIGWHREFTEFGKTLCVQMLGTARVFDDPALYDEGLAIYPYEEFADYRKMEHERFEHEVMRKFMTMTRITINQIIITDSQYARNRGVRVHQIWKRGE